MSGAEDSPVSQAEARDLLAPLTGLPHVVIAVSGGPDSLALLYLTARWRVSRRSGPALLAVTVDHALRPESAREARAVKRIAADLGVPHRTLVWRGHKPAAGLQEAAREARYRLLGEAARRIGARHILTGHTRDDQAETVLLRLAGGSGIAGLRGMDRAARLGDGSIAVLRPLLDIPKSRLVATAARAGLVAADDPSNGNPRFARARLRAAAPLLAREGLTRERMVQLARRLRRADAAIEAAVDALDGIAALDLRSVPEEIALRLVGRAIGRVGDEGPVELGKLEALWRALAGPEERVRRTLAGAMITRAKGIITVERAPPRRSRAPEGS